MEHGGGGKESGREVGEGKRSMEYVSRHSQGERAVQKATLGGR
jgi:hypothetical protein